MMPGRTWPWLLVAALFLQSGIAASAAPETFEAGRDYQRLPGQAQTLADDKIEVVEFFMFSCEHCLIFEPILQAWEQRLPKDVVLRRIPVALGAIGKRYARIFYTAQALDVGAQIQAATFDALQRQKQVLRSDDEVRAFFVDKGIKAEAFDQAFYSPEVESQMTQGVLLAQLYGITTVPSIGVDGRFRLSAQQSRTYQRFLRITDYLVNTSR